MISEMTTRAWLVSAATPAKLQYFGGVIDGATAFYCDPMKGTPLTHAESQRVKAELEQAFSQRNEGFEIVWLGDVAQFRPTFSLITGQHTIRII